MSLTASENEMGYSPCFTIVMVYPNTLGMYHPWASVIYLYSKIVSILLHSSGSCTHVAGVSEVSGALRGVAEMGEVNCTILYSYKWACTLGPILFLFLVEFWSSDVSSPTLVLTVIQPYSGFYSLQSVNDT